MTLVARVSLSEAAFCCPAASLWLSKRLSFAISCVDGLLDWVGEGRGREGEVDR